MWGQLLGGLLSAAGSYQAQKKLGQGADRMFGAGDKAWERGQFTPYGVTTGLGAASFEDGQAQFELDPRYRAQQDTMLNLGGEALGAAGGDYDQLAQQMYDRQRALGADTRSAEAQALGESMFGAGTRGLRVSGEALGAGAGSGMMSPKGYGFAQAFARQDAADRANAYEQSQMQRLRDIDVGTGMLGQATGLDQLGMAGMELGGMLGAQKATAANAAMGNLLQGYASGTDLLARQGQAQAGGMQGLGGRLGSWGSGLPPVGNRMLSTGTIGGQNTWKDYTDNNGYGVG